jgi:2-oxoisovalerate dehydrogenase E1 component alpha subunit
VRLTPHSSDDNDRTYRPAAELKDLRSHDPVARFRECLHEQGVLDDLREQQLREQIKREVDDATTFAEQSPLPDANTLLKHVYAE